MKYVRTVALVIMGLGVSACTTTDVASRNVPFEAPQIAATAMPVKVESFQVRVPQSLRVSEANTYYPSGDIVWRGDPMGNRHQQIKAIFDQSIMAGVKGTDGVVPVIMDIEVTRFHALTEKARYTVGGVHSIEFKLSFLNPETRQPVAPTRMIKADLKAFGGARAIHAEQNGVTQKLRITSHLVSVIRNELGGSGAPVKTSAKTSPVAPTQVTRNATLLNSAPAKPLLAGERTNNLF